MKVRCIPRLTPPPDPLTRAFHDGQPILQFKDLDVHGHRREAWRAWLVIQQLSKARAPRAALDRGLNCCSCGAGYPMLRSGAVDSE